MRKLLGSAALAALLACGAVSSANAMVTADAVIKTYADIAHAGYEDSLIWIGRIILDNWCLGYNY